MSGSGDGDIPRRLIVIVVAAAEREGALRERGHVLTVGAVEAEEQLIGEICPD
jgi:hypothetical protein